MADGKLLNLVLLCVPLSLVSFGGGQSIIAGLQHQTVDIQHILTAREFTDYYAISRAAPGPGTLIVVLIGWHIAGLLGALAAALAIFVPSSALVCIFGSIWQRHRHADWAVAVERGLAPVAAGLIFAGAFAVSVAAGLTLIDIATVAVGTMVLFRSRIGAYPLLAAAAVLYFLLSLGGMA